MDKEDEMTAASEGIIYLSKCQERLLGKWIKTSGSFLKNDSFSDFTVKFKL